MKLSLHHLKRHKTKHRNHAMYHEYDYVRPLRDWAIGLVCVSVVFISGLGLIAFDFYQQFLDSRQELTISKEAISYPEQDVRRYAKLYADRDALFNTLRAQKPQSQTLAQPPTPPVVPVPEPETNTEVADEDEDEDGDLTEGIENLENATSSGLAE